MKRLAAHGVEVRRGRNVESHGLRPTEVPGGFGAQPQTRDYRPDIDGLRAVAVVPVVLYHSGLTLFSGGFVGVDVFFVISGYLITQILHREAQAGKFSIARFYARRIRRIFPALFLMLASTLAAGVWLLLPDELTELARSTIATAIFCSNMLFWSETGYFATAAIYKPLLHTWSLAVEEQFYIFFPLGLWLIHRLRPNALLPALVAVTAASFALNLALVERAPGVTFYMLPTRAWELLAGAIIAIWRFQAPDGAREWMASLGIAIIAASVVLFDEGMPFPGAGALLPVAGTALAIAAGEGTTTGKLLSFAPLRGIGLISYSLYLWHWPVLTFARFAFGSQLSVGVIVACVAFATLMAWISWRFVEAPFRRPGPPALAIATGLSAVTGGVAVAGFLLSGLPSRVPSDAGAIANAGRARSDIPQCFAEQGPNPNVAQCVGGRIVLVGDSHALQFYSPARRVIGEVQLVGRGGCMPIAGVEFIRLRRVDPNCSRFNREVFDEIVRDPTVQTVVLSGRWARLTFPAADGESQRVSREAGAALRQSVAMLQRSGKRVVLIGPVPEFKEPLPACLARARWRSLGEDVCQHNPLTVRNSTVEQWLSSAGADAVIWPGDVLCSEGDCVRMISGRPVVLSRGHLNPDAAELVLRRSGFAEAVKTRPRP